MSRGRLAVVIPDLAVGGLQNMAVGLLSCLDRAEFEPLVYTFDGGGPLASVLAEQGVAHVHLPRGAGVSPGHARVLAARMQVDGIGLVHCHNVTALFHGARAARRLGVPVLFTEHDREMPAPWRHRVLHRWLARRVDRTVAVSARLAQDLVALEGFPEACTATLVNGIPDPRERCHEDRATARQALGWDERPTVLSVGSLTPVKNHAGLLRLVARLAAAREGRLRLVIAGEGPLRGDLETLAAAHLPPGTVELPGNRTDVPRLLAAADVFALPSHREGLPLSLVEAHAMARPSVAFDVGGNAEILVPGATGRLVPAGDEAGFARALDELLDDPARCAVLGASARARYLERFTHERMVTAYVALYRDLVSEPRR